MKKVIINADDFGASREINQAIIKGSKSGIINSTSIMINLLELDKKSWKFIYNTDINLGLHLNLTNGYPVANKADISLLVDKNGKFKNTFTSLLFLSLIHPIKFRQQVEIEIDAQIKKYKSLNIRLSHIDSHRHIHMIPTIFRIVKKLSREYNIDRIRIVNENIFYTIKCNRNYSFLFDGGIIKYLILKFFYYINFYKTNTYFYSILYTGKIFKEKVEKIKIPKKYENLEIMTHPNTNKIDNYSKIFDKNMVSKNRFEEMKMVMDKKVFDKIYKNLN